MNRATTGSTLANTIMAAPIWWVLLVALALVALIGWFDYATGWELDVSALYVLPISLVVFRTDRRLAYVFAVLCSVVWWLAQIQTHPYQTTWGFPLAAVTKAFFFAIVVAAGAAIKAKWQLGSARIKMLERTRHLEDEILHATEQEQQRIGRELHDGLCQSLAGIAALSATLSGRLSRTFQSEAAAAAAEITTLLNEAIGEVRTLAHGLGQVGPQDTDLPTLLEHLAMNAQHQRGVSCNLECDGSFPELGNEVRSHLFRIAQEALNNAVVHGRGQRVEISLSSADGEGRLRIRDDGVGIPDVALQGDGVGLNTMAYRARLIGGSLEVRRHSPHGTAVTCVFPLPAMPDAHESLQRAYSEN